MAATEDRNSAQAIAEAVNEISERASLLVREEIELAKAEVSTKLTRLVKGAAIGGAAAVFAIFGLVILLEGFSWLAWWIMPVGNTQFFWGFFVVAALLFVAGGMAGLFASKLIKKGSPPMPQMAIDEAKITRAELSGEGDVSTRRYEVAREDTAAPAPGGSVAAGKDDE